MIFIANYTTIETNNCFGRKNPWAGGIQVVGTNLRNSQRSSRKICRCRISEPRLRHTVLVVETYLCRGCRHKNPGFILT